MYVPQADHLRTILAIFHDPLKTNFFENLCQIQKLLLYIFYGYIYMARICLYDSQVSSRKHSVRAKIPEILGIHKHALGLQQNLFVAAVYL